MYTKSKSIHRSPMDARSFKMVKHEIKARDKYNQCYPKNMKIGIASEYLNEQLNYVCVSQPYQLRKDNNFTMAMQNTTFCKGLVI